jgi:polysaccharide chain length determinant protein (PEP-CTERM system associated)
MQMGKGIAGNMVNPAVKRLDEQIQADHNKLDQLLLVYTDKYPDVVALKSMIKRLQARKKKLLNAAQSGKPVPVDSSNPVYQNLQNQASAAQVKVKTLQTQIAQQKNRIHQLTQQSDKVTDVQQKLQALNRNYAVTQKQYHELVTRLNRANISQDASHSGNNIKFRVIDPPLKPVAPSSPNRFLLLTMVLGFSLAVGVVFAVFLSQVKPVFMDRHMLRQITGRPVLGTVSLVWTHAQRRMRRTELTGFGLAVCLMIAVYGGCVLFMGRFTHLVQGLLTG